MVTQVPASMEVEGITAATVAAAASAAAAAQSTANTALAKQTGDVVQQIYASSGAVITLASPTLIPFDDTIPQITEGTEILTATITPAASANYLEIEAIVNMSGNTTSGYLVGALFQDSAANAIAVEAITYTGAGFVNQMILRCRIAAGTTSATIIRLRAGPASGTTSQLTINGSAGARLFGGVFLTSLTITEIKA